LLFISPTLVIGNSPLLSRMTELIHCGLKFNRFHELYIHHFRYIICTLTSVVFSNFSTSFLCCRHLVKQLGWWDFVEVNLYFVFDVCSVTKSFSQTYLSEFKHE